VTHRAQLQRAWRVTRQNHSAARNHPHEAYAANGSHVRMSLPGQVEFYDVEQQASKALTLPVGTLDPARVLPIAMHPSGQRALIPIMDAHGNCTLHDVHARGDVQAVRTAQGGWCVGGFLGDEVIVGHQRLGDAPRYELSVGRELWWHSAILQPAATIASMGNEVFALLSVQADPWTHTGAVQLCMVGAVPMPLVEAAGFSVSCLQMGMLQVRDHAQTFVFDVAS
jgi:hypothetical protein